MRPAIVLASIVILLLAAAAARAVEPGTTITAERAAELADVALPGVVAAVRRGMRVEVAESRPMRWRHAYAEATEKNAPQVRLGPQGELLNYVAGLPFPAIDTKDEQAATKIMWNHAFGPWIADDTEYRTIEWQFGGLTAGKPMHVVSQERNDGEYSGWLSLIGRTEVPPLPALPDNQQSVRSMEVFGPTLPVLLTLLKSGPMLTYRYLANREDDSWYYLSFMRTVLRLAPQIRYDGTGGVVGDLNSTAGFSAPVGSYTWRFVGERQMLGVLHARRYPAEWCPEGGDFAPCDVWEPRSVYILEGTARRPYDIYGKRVIAIDKQAWVVLTSDILDKEGKLWKTVMTFWSYRPDPRNAHEERPYAVAGTYLDHQHDEANRWRLPGTMPLAEAVVFDAGLGRDAFTTDALPQGLH